MTETEGPKVGEQVCFTVPATHLAAVDAFAERENLTRSAALRLAVAHFAAETTPEEH
jgi:hypothetical protein